MLPHKKLFMWHYHEIQFTEEGCKKQPKYMEKTVSWEVKHLLINMESTNLLHTGDDKKADKMI